MTVTINAVPFQVAGSNEAYNVQGTLLTAVQTTLDSAFIYLLSNGYIQYRFEWDVTAGSRLVEYQLSARTRRTVSTVSGVATIPGLAGNKNLPGGIGNWQSDSHTWTHGHTFVTSGKHIQDVRFTWQGSTGGAWELNYAQLSIVVSLPPNAPTITSPVGTVNSLTPTFSVSPSNPSGGDPIDATEFQVRRVSDNALMWNSGWKSGTSAAYGGTPLASDVEYRVTARNRNSFGVEGAWSAPAYFTPNTNVPPTAAAIAPSGNIGTLTPTMQLRFNDTPGDTFERYQIQARIANSTTIWDTGWQETNSSQKSAREVNIPYGGTPLSNSTAYQWRGRVEDNYGVPSSYTPWVTFTPSLQPDAPNIVSPRGTQDSLTFDIEGEYIRGAGDVEAAWSYRIRHSGTVIYESGDIDGPIADGQPYGTVNPSGSPLTPPELSWGTEYQISLRSKDALAEYSEWTEWLTFQTNAPPTTPTNLSPSGGGVINATRPTLSWRHNDPNGDAQTAAQIEVRRADDDEPVTGYDPMELEQSDSSHALTEDLTASPATAYRWRVRTRGLEAAGYGPWSDWATFTVSTAPTITVTWPAADEVVTHPAMLFEWTFEGGSGVQQDYQVFVFAEDQSTVIYDSGLRAGSAESHQMPAGFVRNNGRYYRQVTGSDTLGEPAQSAKLPFTTSWTQPDTLVLTVTAIGSQD